MSEEVKEAPLEAESAPVGTINIQVSDNSVKYDTNMALPEMMFWLDVVKAMGINKVMEAKDEE